MNKKELFFVISLFCSFIAGIDAQEILPSNTKFIDAFKEIKNKSHEEQQAIYQNLGNSPFDVIPSQVNEAIRYGLISENFDIKLNVVNYLRLTSAMNSAEVIEFFVRNDDLLKANELLIVSQNGDERLTGFALINVGTEKSDIRATNLLIKAMTNEKGEYERIEMIRGLRHRMVNAREVIEPVLIDEIINSSEAYREPIEAALLLKDYDNPPKEVIELVIE